tara:strand:- start:52 stop:909 length:858 start_codon:yes stop_codon:yes gene_type:complete
MDQVQTTEQQPVQPGVSEQTTTTPDQSQPVTQEEPKVDFKSLIPNEYKEDKALANFEDMNQFVKSYLHAQKMVGLDKIPVPNKYATDEDWKEVYKRLGAPEKPDQYKYKFDKGQEVDENTLKSFNEVAQRNGLLPKQAENLVKFYNELNQQALSKEASQIDATRLESEAVLKRDFGSEYNKRLDQAKRLAVNTLGSEFLNNTILKNGSKLGDNVALIKAFSSLADKLSEDEIVKGEGSDYMSAKELQRQLDELQQKGSPYWDKMHPNHKRNVDEVFKLREMLNNG